MQNQTNYSSIPIFPAPPSQNSTAATSNNQTLPQVKGHEDIFAPFRHVALIFFIILGSLHIFSGLLASANYLLPYSNLTNKVLDIPFAIIAASYALSNIRLKDDSPNKNIIFTMIGLCLLGLLLILLYINIFIPDRIIK